MKNFLFVALIFVSGWVNAGDCVFDNVHVRDVERWDNGEIFIYFSQADGGCVCSQKSRLAIPAGNDDDFLKSQILLVVASGKKVRAVGRPRESDNYCTVHGNTAELVTFRILAD